MFKKIGNNVPDHHLVFFSGVLTILFFILLFSPFVSSTLVKQKARAASPPPVISFTSPIVNGYLVVLSDSVVIEGSVTDSNDPVGSCSWVNHATGQTGSLAPHADWTITATNLVWGLNEVEFIANAGGDTTTVIINVYRLPDDGELYGYVWSENIGWISLTSLNCDADSDGYSDGDGDCPPTSSTTPRYGVKIDKDNGNLSGYAWSENIGWISFEESESTPDLQSFNSSCYDDGDASNDCTDSSGCTACYSPIHNGSGLGKLFGWGKILSLDDDGWLSLSSTTYSIGFDISAGSLDGYAWNGASSIANEDNAIGWVSFSCSNNSSCNSVEYGALAGINMKPEVSFDIMSAPGHCIPSKACDTSINCELNPELRWTYFDPEGFNQERFQIIFDTANHSLSSLDSLSDSSGSSLPLKTPVINSTINYFVPSNNSYRNVDINYGTTYYAWIKVWDNYGEDSGWVNLFSDNTQMNFTTFKSQFPNPSFDFFIEEGSASAGEEIKFWDTSIYYFDSSGTSIDNSGGAAECVVPTCSYYWSSPDVIIGSISNDDEATTTARYPDSGGQEMILEVTDGNGYACSTSTTIDINEKLPSWIEVR